MDKWFEIVKWSEPKLKKKFNIEYKKTLTNSMMGLIESDTVAQIFYIISKEGSTDKQLACKIQFPTKEKFDEFRYYVSKKRLQDMEREKRRRYLLRLKTFEESLNNAEFDEFLNKITKEYLIDLLQDVSCFNVPMMVKEAKPYFVRTVFVHYEEEDIPEEEMKKEISRIMFFKHYPTLKKFSGLIGDLASLDTLPDDGLHGSLMEEVNVMYGMRLVEYGKNLRRIL